jgi:hypothetical protein
VPLVRVWHEAAWVHRVAPAKVIVFGDAHGQTTYRFRPAGVAKDRTD